MHIDIYTCNNRWNGESELSDSQLQLCFLSHKHNDKSIAYSVRPCFILSLKDSNELTSPISLEIKFHKTLPL